MQITSQVIPLAHISPMSPGTVISIDWLISPFLYDKVTSTLKCPKGSFLSSPQNLIFSHCSFYHWIQSIQFYKLETYFILETFLSVIRLCLNHHQLLWVLSPKIFWSTSPHFLSLTLAQTVSLTRNTAAISFLVSWLHLLPSPSNSFSKIHPVS